MVSYLEGKGMRFERADGFSDYYDELPGGETRGRALVGKLFDINELGEWKDRLSVYPGQPLRFSAADLPHLLLVTRTWSARRAAARLAARMLRDALLRRDMRGAGGAIQGRMLQIALRQAIPIRPKTPVVGFMVQDGRVTGVEVESDGHRKRIGARRGVLINAGGFAHNGRMRDKYGPHPSSNAWTMSNPGDTGEVIESAMALGAATDCMDEAWWFFTSLGPGEKFPDKAINAEGTPVPMPHHMDVSLPHSIVVDQDGNRFTNESASYVEKGQRMYVRHRQTGRAIPAWAIIESRHRKRYPWGPVLGPTPRKWLRTGYMKKAQTLEELAGVCGIDADGLRATVDRFNGFCTTGVDEDYKRGARVSDRAYGDPTVKPNPNLGTIEQAPFYAVAIYPSDLGTAGGLVTDEHSRVLGEDGVPIDGLYATGNSTASVMGRSYPTGGASVAASFVFGYRAAKHAVARKPYADRDLNLARQADV
jgi:3-oxosteroid 1-dehydrogenase